MNIIETRNLTKEYQRFTKQAGLLGSIKSLFHREYVTKTAVSSFDLTVAEGEFIGLIGPNGAGRQHWSRC
jgi:ABC-2 type transport system ATP-binding protein